MKNGEKQARKEALLNMQRLCSTREKCSFDIREKLKSQHLSDSDIGLGYYKARRRQVSG